MTWRAVQFGDFVDIQPRTVLEKGEEYSFVEMADLQPYRKDVAPRTTRVWSGSGGAKFRDGDTLLARITPCLENGKTAKVSNLKGGVGFGSTEFIVFRAKPGISDPDYVYYLARSQVIRGPAIKSMIGASGRQRARENVIGEIQFNAPPLKEQVRIGKVISAFDELIENNRRRIALLEQSARLLYREWFVHLRFPGHEHVKVVDGVPEGWERKPLREIATLNYGKALKEELRQPGPYPVYGSSGIVGSHVAGLTSGPGIIVGRKGNVGSVYWSPVAFFAIDTVYFISVEQSSLYLYYTLQDAQFISTDVAVPGLNRDFAYSRQLLVPADQVLSEFLEAVMPFHQQIEKLTILSEKLHEARDLLLPRLMSGDLVV